MECLWHPNPILPIEPARREVGKKLLDIRTAFLHRGIGKAYRGYICDQLRRLRQGKRLHTKGGVFNTKWAAHIVRLTYALEHLVSKKEILVRLPETLAEEIRRIRKGEFSEEYLRKELLPECEKRAEAAIERLDLPREPDWDVIDDFCYFACVERL